MIKIRNLISLNLKMDKINQFPVKVYLIKLISLNQNLFKLTHNTICHINLISLNLHLYKFNRVPVEVYLIRLISLTKNLYKLTHNTI